MRRPAPPPPRATVLYVRAIGVVLNLAVAVLLAVRLF
jgi:hypothetical protein